MPSVSAAARRLGLLVASSPTNSRARYRLTGRNDLATRPGSRSASPRTRAAELVAPADPVGSFANGLLVRRPRLALRPAPLLVVPPKLEGLAQLPPPPSPQRRNWSVQLTGGPSLTYRRLPGTSTQLEKLERPAWGGSGQLLGAYAFSPRLTVAGGLGFAQHAGSLRYTLQSTASGETRQVDFRDVYNFVTLPVQAQLTLGGNHRWRYGVLGGAVAAQLISARVTTGSACNCAQQRWRPSSADSIFQRRNLTLTVGAFADYQLSPGRWLTVRPQAELFLNSLTLPPRTSRYPWGLGVQVGYRWDLAPRKP
ncbi:hypothetical protein CDA63_05180 [Hymenobacter amundsenii]|uniref:Uncharacterized protein n=1 Tax=Hymenobacter amundsenii TaxID=2006685 RepID=A0A246FQS1_9BACT|nr:hypothetical protein CDA63_05180 [Hymenobacter amundsenii]